MDLVVTLEGCEPFALSVGAGASLRELKRRICEAAASLGGVGCGALRGADIDVWCDDGRGGSFTPTALRVSLDGGGGGDDDDDDVLLEALGLLPAGDGSPIHLSVAPTAAAVARRRLEAKGVPITDAMFVDAMFRYAAAVTAATGEAQPTAAPATAAAAAAATALEEARQTATDMLVCGVDAKKHLYAALINACPAPVVELLLDFGADMQAAADLSGAGRLSGRAGRFDPVFVACRAGDVATARLLLERGGRVDGPGVLGLTAVEVCVMDDQREILALLLAHGADANRTGPLGVRPLHGVMSVETATLLLDAGADVDALDSRGETALRLAAAAGRADIVRLLAARGADVNACDPRGGTALRYALAKQHAATAAVLRDLGAADDAGAAAPDSPLSMTSA